MSTFVFEPFALDAVRRRLTKSGEPVAISERQAHVLLQLVTQGGTYPGQRRSDCRGMAGRGRRRQQPRTGHLGAPESSGAGAVWRRVHRNGSPARLPLRRGGRASRVTRDRRRPRCAARAAPGIRGGSRRARDARSRTNLARARGVRGRGRRRTGYYAFSHVGLATASLMRFEATRADPAPDAPALARAVHHARDACRLDPSWAEAWATLGFALGRTVHRVDAIAAANPAAALEPDNWRHHFRLAYVTWGEARLRAAHRTLGLPPRFPARALAGRDRVCRAPGLGRGRAGARRGDSPRIRRARSSARSPCTGCAVLFTSRAAKPNRLLPSSSANWRAKPPATCIRASAAQGARDAIGALRTRQGRQQEAEAAFDCALERISHHPMALAALGRDRIWQRRFAQPLSCSPARYASPGPARTPTPRGPLPKRSPLQTTGMRSGCSRSSRSCR